MKTFLRMMKYLMYGVFALLFMMSWAFLGQEPQWNMLVFNAPALLYLAARLLFAIFKSRSVWAAIVFFTGLSCLEYLLFRWSYGSVGVFIGAMYVVAFALLQFIYLAKEFVDSAGPASSSGIFDDDESGPGISPVTGEYSGFDKSLGI